MHYYKAIGKVISGRRILALIVAGLAYPAAATDQSEFLGGLKDRFSAGWGVSGMVVAGVIAAICVLAAIAAWYYNRKQEPTHDTEPAEPDREMDPSFPKRKKHYRFIYPAATESKTGTAARNEKTDL
jgi:hypothetical protein